MITLVSRTDFAIMPKIPQIRIYAGKPLQDFLATRPLKTCWQSQARAGMHGVRDTAEEITVNVAINRLAERHEWLMRQSMPELNDKTWLALLDSFNGTEHTIDEFASLVEPECLFDIVYEDLDCFNERLEDESNEEFFARTAILDGDDEGVMDEKFLVRAEELTGIEFRRLMCLTPAEILAVIEGIERYWGRNNDQASWREIVENKVRD